MTWATLVGGARACLATRWRVEDRATGRLLSAFYEEYRQGCSRRRALQRAQLRLLRDPRYGSPYYWAGAMLTGR